MEGFKIHVELDAEDLRSYEREKATAADYAYKFFLWIGIALSGLIASSFVQYVTGKSIFAFGFLVAYVISLNVFFRTQKDRSLKHLAEKSINYDLIVDASGVMQKVGRTEKKYQWTEVAVVDRSPDFVEFKMWDGDVIVIPQALFETEEKLTASIEFASERLKLIQVGHG